MARSRVLIVIFVPVMLVVFVAVLYLPNITLVGLGTGSKSITESRDLGVHDRTYVPVSNEVVINDSLVIKIVEMWSERHWVRGRVTGTIRVDEEGEASFLVMRCEVFVRGMPIVPSTRSGVVFVADGNAMIAYDDVGRYSCVWPGRVSDTVRLVVGQPSTRLVDGIRSVTMDTLATVVATSTSSASPQRAVR